VIVTVTPNPSLDRTVQVPALTRGAVLRATATFLDPGGKGVNVARALAANGYAAVAVLPCGGPEGRQLAELLDAAGIATSQVPVCDPIRENVTVAEPDGTVTKLNAPGPTLAEADIEALLAAAAAAAGDDAAGDDARTSDAGRLSSRTSDAGRLSSRTSDAGRLWSRTSDAGRLWVAGCGSLPPGVPEDFYARLVARVRGAGGAVAVDTSGPALRAALASGPDLVKPNAEELAEVAGRRLATLGDVVEAARSLRAEGCGAVLASLGADGAVLVDATGAAHAETPPQRVASAVGAGDALLAGALALGGAGPAALAEGVAWGAAAARLPGTRMPGPADLARDQVQVQPPDPSRVLEGA
jgi:1-phosphofructokinase